MDTRERRYDAIVIGGGPAGLNAALVLGRARRSVLVIDDGAPRNAAAERMHGFLTRDGTPPSEMMRIARAEVGRYPTVAMLDAHAVSAHDTALGFVVGTADGAQVIGRRLLLTTGVFDALPAVEGLPERWGRSVFVCPFCDGWEVQNRRFAVSGRGREAVELAQELTGWTDDLIVCPDRDDLTAADRAWIAAAGADLHVGTLRRLSGANGSLERAIFEDGSEITCEALFVSAPLRQHSPLFRTLGCALTDQHAIAVDANYQTSHRGCYAAGDAVTSVHQVIVAAASGVRAAIAMTTDLIDADLAQRMRQPSVF
jgi:thioredoxin reductase